MSIPKDEIPAIVYNLIEERLMKLDSPRPVKISLEHKFEEDLGFDSLDKIEFIMDVEDEFDLNISDEDAKKVVKVKDAIDYLEKNYKAA